MGNSQSNHVSKSVPIVTKPITLVKSSAHVDGAKILHKMADALAEHDVGERMARDRVIGRDCLGTPKPFSCTSPDHSGAEVLGLYQGVRYTGPLPIERAECFKRGTSDLIDNVIYSKLYVPPTPCCVIDKKTMGALAMCVAVPICCPCITLCWLLGDCSSAPKPTVSDIERVKSLMATFRALEKYIEDAPSSKGFCCFQRQMGFDKPTLRLYIGLFLLDEIDTILADMMSTMSNINTVYDALMPLLKPKERDDLLKKLAKSKMKKAGTPCTKCSWEEPAKPSPKEDAHSDAMNKQYNEFLIGKRVCRDFIGNDLLSILFNCVEKTPIGGSVNFIPQKFLNEDPAEIQEKIQRNFESLLPVNDRFLPTAVEPIVNIIKEALGVYCMTIRVKQASHVMEKKKKARKELEVNEKKLMECKDNSEKLLIEEQIVKNKADIAEGTQDLLGIRLFIGAQKVFNSFAIATGCAYKIKQLSNVVNVVVSHKLKYNTGYLDYKIIVELSGPNNPFFEIEIMPSENFVLDEAVGGHAQHKG